MAEDEVKIEKKKGAPPKYATKEEFNQLQGQLSQVLEILTKKAEKPETPEEKAVDKAKPDNLYVEPVNPHWTAAAKDILGDFLDRIEVFYPPKGGTHFTVIIKKEKSNAPADYLAFYKEDRRTCDVSTEGLEGVKNFCNLVKSNLNRTNVKS